jgi:hypothetical protein
MHTCALLMSCYITVHHAIHFHRLACWRGTAAAQVSIASPAAAGMTGPPGMMQQTPPPAAAAGLTGAMPGSAGLPPAPQLSAGKARDSSSGCMAPLPGAAPLHAESWTLENQFGHKGAVKAISDAYDQTLPRIPELPGKVKYTHSLLRHVHACFVCTRMYPMLCLLLPERAECWDVMQPSPLHLPCVTICWCTGQGISTTHMVMVRSSSARPELTWLSLLLLLPRLCPAMPRSPTQQQQLQLLRDLPQSQTWTPPLQSEQHGAHLWPASAVQHSSRLCL